MHLALPPEFQLIKLLGDVDLLEKLLPSDLVAFFNFCKAYRAKYSELDPVAEVLVAWLKDPVVIKIFEDLAPGPSSSSLDIVRALHATMKKYSGQYQKELGSCLHQGRGAGFTACINRLGIAQKMTAEEAYTQMCLATSADNFALNIGSNHDAYMLLEEF